MKIDKTRLCGVFLEDSNHVLIISGPESLEFLVSLDLSEITYKTPITTRKQLVSICKAINENRLGDLFNSQAFMSMILEKYPPESLINE